MNKEAVINQLVYYLNYGFINKNLQEDIQEGLLKKKDLIDLERLLDSVEYELYKNSNNNYHEDNNYNFKNKIINNNFNLKLKDNNSTNIKNYSNKFNDSINQTADPVLNDIIFIEEDSKKLNNNNKKEKLKIKITPFITKIFNIRKNKIKFNLYSKVKKKLAN